MFPLTVMVTEPLADEVLPYPYVAFVDEAGSISAHSAGKAKITAKINGLAVTVNVVVTN